MAIGLRAPGVALQFDAPPPVVALPTGVPVFLGYSQDGPMLTPVALRLREQIAQTFTGSMGPSPATGFPQGGFLAEAAAAFFENGGTYCYVVRLPMDQPPIIALQGGLDACETIADIDLVCAPDIVAFGASPPLSQQVSQMIAQQALLTSVCDSGLHRMALLDPIRLADGPGVTAQRGSLEATNAALYFPWVRIASPRAGTDGMMPPCGHVAGVIARIDSAVGVHKAPANEVLRGVVDLSVLLNDQAQAALNPLGINAIRSFPGRGIRIWGARTLSRNTAWTYVNVRRFFLTACRWIEGNTIALAFEPNDTKLQGRLVRILSAYFAQAWQRGALPGATARDAFYVRCDDTTNPPEVRAKGQVIAEIGIAAQTPYEFINARIVLGDGGAAIVPAAT
jgi:phage tail sheath protein FI